MNWKIIEEKINETIPKCIKKVLDICGYDTIMKLKTTVLQILKKPSMISLPPQYRRLIAATATITKASNNSNFCLGMLTFCVAYRK